MKVYFEDLTQPNENEYLWRYLKPERIESLLKGEVYFSSLLDFQDQHEAITPLHAALFKFLSYNANKKFDLQTPLGEQDVETTVGTFMMWLALYDLEKKLATLGLVEKTEQVPEILQHYLGQPTLLHKPHIDTLTSFYSSCWFVGNYDESSLMWSSYSKPGGVAVRIGISDFKKQLVEYFESRALVSEGIKKVFCGLIDYVDHDADFEEWNNKIKNGVPLAFFKQHHFKEEREFRILLERKTSKQDVNFKRIHPIFGNLKNYEIILHPSSRQNEFAALKEIIPIDKGIKLNFSRLRFNK